MVLWTKVWFSVSRSVSNIACLVIKYKKKTNNDYSYLQKFAMIDNLSIVIFDHPKRITTMSITTRSKLQC